MYLYQHQSCAIIDNEPLEIGEEECESTLLPPTCKPRSAVISTKWSYTFSSGHLFWINVSRNTGNMKNAKGTLSCQHINNECRCATMQGFMVMFRATINDTNGLCIIGRITVLQNMGANQMNWTVMSFLNAFTSLIWCHWHIHTTVFKAVLNLTAYSSPPSTTRADMDFVFHGPFKTQMKVFDLWARRLVNLVRGESRCTFLLSKVRSGTFPRAIEEQHASLRSIRNRKYLWWVEPDDLLLEWSQS